MDMFMQSKLNFVLVCPFKYHFCSTKNYFIYRDKVQILLRENTPNFEDHFYIHVQTFRSFKIFILIFKTNNEPFS